MTLVIICPSCNRSLRTIVNQIGYGDDHRAMLKCKQCGKIFRMTLEDVTSCDVVDGWIIKEEEE